MMAQDRSKGWLGRRASTMKEEVRPEPEQEEYNSSAARRIAEQTTAIDKALPELLARRQEFFDAAVAAHSADSAAYKFECRRHGDFLAVFCERLEFEGTAAKFSTAINLLLVKEIRLHPGCEPGIERRVNWTVQSEFSDVERTLRAHPWAFLPKVGGPCFRRDEDNSGSYFYGSDTMQGGSMPTKSEDDAVNFFGAGCALLAPFGSGQGVLDVILAEMAATPTPGKLP